MKTLSALLLAASLGIAASPPPAAQALDHGYGYGSYQSLISTREAIAAALRAYPGAEALDARLIDGGRPFYLVRLMQQGRRFDVRVDAVTGRIIG
ncbi:MAG: PepSY domain-containing protein [Oceanicaulis sp.]